MFTSIKTTSSPKPPSCRAKSTKEAPFPLDIERLALPSGHGIAKLNDGRIAFVKKAYGPGERVLAKIDRIKPNYVECTVVERLAPPTPSQPPPCPHFAQGCNGCSLQSLPYSDQLSIKSNHVAETLKRNGGFASIPLEPILPSPETLGYRNKITLAIKDGCIGYHRDDQDESVLPISKCLLQPDVGNDILAVMSAHLDPAMTRVTIRSSSLGAWMVILEASRDSDKILQLSQILVQRFSDTIKSIHLVIAVPDSKRPGAKSKSKTKLLYGQSTLPSKLHALDMQISPTSFAQVNTLASLQMVQLVCHLAQLDDNKAQVVVDLYCGTGTFALSLAPKARHVFGVEVSREAIDDAIRNATRNSITNATFLCGNATHLVTQDVLPAHPDVIITDPARAGMTKDVIDYLVQSKARRIIYISCNPATASRDLALLAPHYRLSSVHPLDMFPQTLHVEMIAVLDKL